MPWTANDAESHTSKADTPKKKKTWAEVANKALKSGDSEASAIKQANSVVAKMNSEDKGADDREELLEEERATNAKDEEDEETKQKDKDPDKEKAKKKADDEEDKAKKKDRRAPDPVPSKLEAEELAKIGRRELRFSSSPSSYNSDTREADAVVSTGCSVLRKDFWSGESWNEVLEVGKNSVRLNRLNAGAQLLDGHDHFGGIDAILGAVVPGSARIENGKVFARFRFSRSDKGERLARDLADGIPIMLSAGYKVHREVRDSTTTPETRKAVDWEPMEVSVVTVPAEGGDAGFRSDSNIRCRALPGFEEVRMSDVDTGKSESPPPVDTNAIAARTLEAERVRMTDIMAICRQGNIDVSLAETAIKDGRTVDQFRALAFEELAKRSSSTAIAPSTGRDGEAMKGRWDPVTCRVVRDEVEGRSEAMAEALLTRILSSRRQPAIRSDEQAEWAKIHGKQDIVRRSWDVFDGRENPSNPRTREYLSSGFAEMAAECLGYHGHIRTQQHAYELIVRAMQSTSDYPSIFENVLNKTLMARYTLALPTYREIAVERPFNDFRPHPMIRAGEFPVLEELTETNELRVGASADLKETVSVKPYGKIFKISRQMIVNDEMGAIDQILGSVGDMVLLFENRTFFTMFTGNPTLLQDSTAVFADTHGNLSSPGSVPSVSSIGTMRAALRAMKSISGWYLNVPPRIILTGPLTETLADQMVTAIAPTLTTSVNPFSGRLRSISDANITDHSWYLFTEPGQLPCFVYGFLAGATGPRVRTQEPFGVQGVDISVEHDFGCGAIDYRGAYKNVGTGTIVSGG